MTQSGGKGCKVYSGTSKVYFWYMVNYSRGYVLYMLEVLQYKGPSVDTVHVIQAMFVSVLVLMQQKRLEGWDGW